MGSQRVRHNCATKPPPLKILPLTPYYHLLFSQYKISLLFSLILQLVKLGSRQGFHLSCSLCHSVQFRSFAQSCPTLFNPMNCSSPGLPVHHQLPAFTQTQSIKSVMPSSHLILCRPLLLLPPIPPSIRVFSNELTLHMKWPKYCSFIFSIIPSKEIPEPISFRMD